MGNYPMNIWVIDENEFEEFTYTGGKVIYIVEEPKPIFATHPAIVTAGALLPPVDAIQAELNGSMFEANAIYTQYLQSEEADPFVSIIIAAGINNIPIGIMFGKDELEMQFPKMFLDFIYKSYGLAPGIKGKLQPSIAEELVPRDLAKLYMMNIISYSDFMVKHPPLPIDPNVISKMAYEENPLVKERDFNHYYEYFENFKNTILKYGGKFLIDPMVNA